ncbi:MAG: AP endonuclease [Bacteroidetes bacterium QH_10_64_37]|jgi:sugar phosphate isomerase/epimerase|nr:MAG: AP endonuclease [Bacteroidetes bacterium QH_10_64_37]
MDRRRFFKTSAAMMAGAGVSAASTPLSAVARTAPLYRISLAQWSLHRALFEGEMDNLDFAPTAKEEFGIDAVEYVNQFFMDEGTDTAYLQKMKRRADEAGVRSLIIMCDGEGALGAADSKKRRQAIENHHKWVEAAARLGCHSIRVNARSSGSYEEQKERAVDGLRRLTEFAAPRDINVLVENHGGLSSNGQWLASVMEAVDHPRCGTLPDFGNFTIREGKTYNRYKGTRELMPYAEGVSAKTYSFDDAGNAVETDYERMMGIVLDAGYHGHAGIEYEGDEMSEFEGIRATKALLERVRKQLRSEYE